MNASVLGLFAVIMVATLGCRDGTVREPSSPAETVRRVELEFEQRQLELEKTVLAREYEMLRLRRLELEIEREVLAAEPPPTTGDLQPHQTRPALDVVGMKVSTIHRLIADNRHQFRQLLERELKLLDPAPHDAAIQR